MRTIVGLLLGLGLFALANGLAVAQGNPVQPTATTTQKKDLEVVGGKPVSLAESPWQVALMDINQPLVFGPVCGGTAIADKWVLTAAHCFYDVKTCKVRFTAARLWIMHGTTDLATNTPKLVRISRIHMPTPDFDCKTFASDIALLELRDLLPNAFRMRLPNLKEDAAFDLAPGRLKASGWGQTSEDGAISQLLLEVAVPSVPLTVCKQALEPELLIPEKTLCAGEYGKDTCRGDSGGPLFRRLQSSTAEAVQFGITSFGSGCGQRDRPGVYTRVAAYTDWIRATMSLPGCTPALAAAGKC